MKIKQFQHEAVTDRLSTITKSFDRDTVPDAGQEDCIAGLLFNLHINHRMVENDLNYLGSLCQNETTFFLIKDETFLYPDGYELFPYEIIESAVNQGGQAIFTQNFRKSKKRSDEQYKIISSLLNSYKNGSVVIGLVGKGLPYRNFSEEDAFMSNVNMFRKIENDIQPLLKQVKKQLSANSAKVIINRNNGMILAVNPKAEELFGYPSKNILGMTLEQLKTRVAPSFVNRRVTMENINSEYLNLAVLSIGFEPDKPELDFNKYTIDQIRIHSNNIILASSCLETIQDDDKKMIKLISGEAERINEIVYQSHLQQDFKKIHLVEQNLLNELDHALDLMTRTTGRKIDAKIINLSRDTNIMAPEGVTTHIFEQVLALHNMLNATNNYREIFINQISDEIIQFVVESEASINPDTSLSLREKTAYVKSLTKKMNIDFNQSFDKIKNITTLIIRLDSFNGDN